MLTQSDRRDPVHTCRQSALLDSFSMSEATTKSNDPSAALMDALDQLDAGSLSYVQLGLLHKAMQNALKTLNEESARRADEDDAGDTVVIPAS